MAEPSSSAKMESMSQDRTKVSNIKEEIHEEEREMTRIGAQNTV